jgi:hypothetical protein
MMVLPGKPGQAVGLDFLGLREVCAPRQIMT